MYKGEKRTQFLKDEKLKFLMDEYIALGDTLYVFRIFISYYWRKKPFNMPFSHSGSFTRIPYLHIVENQHKLHQKSANIFWAVREVYK